MRQVNKEAIQKRVEDFLGRHNNGNEGPAYQALVAVFGKRVKIPEQKPFVHDYLLPAVEQAIAIAVALEEAGLIFKIDSSVEPNTADYSLTKEGQELIERHVKEFKAKKNR